MAERRASVRSGRRKNNNSNKKSVAIGAAIVFLALIVGVSIVAAKKYVEYNEMKSILDVPYIYNNVYIDGIHVGGLTKEQAVQRLEEEIQKPFGQKEIVLRVPDPDGGSTHVDYKFTYDDFGAKYDLNTAVNEAYDFGRSGSVKERFETVKEAELAGKHCPAEFDVTLDNIKVKVEELTDKVYVAPVNATAERKNGRFVISGGTNGQKLDVDATVTAVYEFIKIKEEGTVYVTTEEIEPEFKESDFNEMNDEIGTYSSAYSGGSGSEGRITNLRVAASKLNGQIIFPGETFSVNAEFNPCTAANGWVMAATIVKGKIEDSLGGGMCQVSSALYDAALYAELEIVERHNHSMKVSYAPYAYDATLAGDYKDLKIKNNTDAPVYIESYLANSRVVVNLYGKEIHSASRRLEFKNELVSTTEPGEPVKIDDDTLPEGEEKVTQTALKGYKYNLYKYIYEDGKLLEKVHINTSTYSPRRQEISVGTGKSVEASNSEDEAVEDAQSSEQAQDSEPAAEVAVEAEAAPAVEEVPAAEQAPEAQEAVDVVEDIVVEPVVDDSEVIRDIVVDVN